MHADTLLQEYVGHADQLYSSVLADVLDGLGRRRQALPKEVRPLCNDSKILGKIRTLKMKEVFEIPEKPYALELKAIDDLRPGDVLVIEMNEGPECGVWGELLSTAAKARGAVGAVMNGPTRDTAKILELGFPTFAVGASPLDSKGRIDATEWDRPIHIGNVAIRPGDLLFGDRDGVVVIPHETAGAVLAAALEKVHGENTVRAELLAGQSVADVFARHGIL